MILRSRINGLVKITLIILLITLLIVFSVLFFMSHITKKTPYITPPEYTDLVEWGRGEYIYDNSTFNQCMNNSSSVYGNVNCYKDRNEDLVKEKGNGIDSLSYIETYVYIDDNKVTSYEIYSPAYDIVGNDIISYNNRIKFSYPNNELLEFSNSRDNVSYEDYQILSQKYEEGNITRRYSGNDISVRIPYSSKDAQSLLSTLDFSKDNSDEFMNKIQKIDTELE